MLKKTIIFTWLCIFLFTACSEKELVYFEDSGSVFNTRYTIKYQATEPMTQLIEAEFDAFNLSLNPFNPNSIIAKINRNEEVEVDEWFTTVFKKAQEVSSLTGGKFDITCSPLINAWGFGFSKIGEVTPHIIDSLKEFIGYEKIRLVGNKIVKEDDRITLNCSAIAKGFACDVIASLFEREGVTNYLVDIGGELTLRGVNPNGDCWRSGIRRPELVNPNAPIAIEEVIQLCKKGGIATSGDYQNFYIKNGKKYAHTIDPISGYPAEQNILSSTVVAENCMTADAYATAFNAMGLEEAVKIAETLPEKIEYFFIYTGEDGNFKFKYSKGIIQYLPNRKDLAILENP